MITKQSLNERIAINEILLSEVEETLMDLEKRLTKLEKKEKKREKDLSKQYKAVEGYQGTIWVLL